MYIEANVFCNPSHIALCVQIRLSVGFLALHLHAQSQCHASSRAHLLNQRSVRASPSVRVDVFIFSFSPSSSMQSSQYITSWAIFKKQVHSSKIHAPSFKPHNEHASGVKKSISRRVASTAYFRSKSTHC